MIELTPDQQVTADAFMTFMLTPDEPVMVVKGHSGSGKSTLTKYMVDMINNQGKLLRLLGGDSGDVDMYVTATTNKAAKVIGEICGTPAQTIHSLLGLRMKPNYATGKETLVKTRDYKAFSNVLIFIDEGSFIGPDLKEMIEESTSNCKVVYILDPYQVAPVGHLLPPIAEMDVPTCMLSTVKRNPGPIAELGAKYREVVYQYSLIAKEVIAMGLPECEIEPMINHLGAERVTFPTIIADDHNILCVNGLNFRELVDTEFNRPVREDNDAKIIAWTNDKATAYNQHIRDLHGYGACPAVGERMITNNHIMNGNIRYSTDSIVGITHVGEEVEREGIKGHMVELDRVLMMFLPNHQKEAKAVKQTYAKKKDFGMYFQLKESWLDLRPLHACTSHKSQGSTYIKAFIDLPDIGECRNASDVARMLYVASTRPTTQVIFYGALPEKYGGAPIPNPDPI